MGTLYIGLLTNRYMSIRVGSKDTFNRLLWSHWYHIYPSMLPIIFNFAPCHRYNPMHVNGRKAAGKGAYFYHDPVSVSIPSNAAEDYGSSVNNSSLQ